MTVADPLSILADRLDPPSWEPTGRPPLEPHQVPPPGRWSLWVLRGGRGSGKTEACARYFASWMRRHPGHRGRIIAPTFGDAVEACIEGPSGLRSIDPDIRWMPSAPGGAKVVWPNGSEAVVIGTHTPADVDRLRAAGNRNIDWWEEMAANRQLEDAWRQAAFGLRLGDWPHSIASTTPRNRKAFRALLERRTTVQTHGTIDDNPHLPVDRKEELKAEYAGTRIGRQELGGELLTDVPGALWTWEMIEQARALWDDAHDLVRVVVAIDPAVTSGDDADEVGIIPAGRRADGLGAVLGDRSCQGLSPAAWAARGVQAYDDYQADRIVGEVNNGGELVESVIRTVRPAIPFKAVRASRGKQARAEPIAAQFEQGRWALPPGLDLLVDQLTTWTPDSGESPGRLDAMVWGCTELRLGQRTGIRKVKPPRR